MKQFIYVVLSIALLTSSAYSSEKSAKKDASTTSNTGVEKIEINGVKKSLLEHICAAVLKPNTNVFSATRVIEYNSNGTSTETGDIRTISKEALKHVQNGNFIYVPDFKQAKTHLSTFSYAQVGAIVVGTKDNSIGEKLCSDAARTQIHRLLGAQKAAKNNQTNKENNDEKDNEDKK